MKPATNGKRGEGHTVEVEVQRLKVISVRESGGNQNHAETGDRNLGITRLVVAPTRINARTWKNASGNTRSCPRPACTP